MSCCWCGYGVTPAMANSPALLQVHHVHRLCALPSTIPACSEALLHPGSSARCASWSRKASPLLARARVHESAESTGALRAPSSLGCVERAPQGGNTRELETLQRAHDSVSVNGNGDAKSQELPELVYSAVDRTPQLEAEEFLFTQDYLDSLDYDSFVNAPQDPPEESVVVNLSCAPLAERRLRPKSVRINVVRTVRKGGRALPASIAEVLPVKPETSVKFYFGLYGALLRAGRYFVPPNPIF